MLQRQLSLLHLRRVSSSELCWQWTTSTRTTRRASSSCRYGLVGSNNCYSLLSDCCLLQGESAQGPLTGAGNFCFVFLFRLSSGYKKDHIGSNVVCQCLVTDPTSVRSSGGRGVITHTAVLGFVCDVQRRLDYAVFGTQASQLQTCYNLLCQVQLPVVQQMLITCCLHQSAVSKGQTGAVSGVCLGGILSL